MRFGLPYQGSKNKLAERIVALLPSAKHLYDVFAGGCAITHCALLSGKWECVHFSDTNDSVSLFKDCLEGNVPDGSRWISREEFEMFKDTDPYIRIVWSFGNNQRDYLYSRQIEPYKKAVHEMIFASTPTERRLKFREVCKLMPTVIGEGGVRPTDHESTERSQRLHTDFSQQKQLLPPEFATAISQAKPIRESVALRTAREIWGGVSNCIDCRPKSADAQSPIHPFVVGSMR